ncbi:MAG: hypothetical protein IKK63_09185 [Clostridia bacterium]|nr:hypothetical protein [Clostridia bacterium]
MRNINKISPKVYLFLTVFSAVIAMIIYRATIFRPLFFSTFDESTATLWLIWGTCLAGTYLMTFKRRRNYFSLFTNTVLPFGIYSAKVYDTSHYIVVGAIGFAILILCGLFYLALIFGNNISDNPDKRRKMFKNGIAHCLNGTKSIVAVCLSVLIIYVTGLSAFDSPSLVPAVKPSASVEEDKDECLKNNLPAISKIEKSIWETVPFEDRLDTLQTMANVETVRSGISHEINICAEDLGLGTYGCYDFQSHTVTINTRIIEDDDPTDAVTTLFHEIRHAYQHDLTDFYLSIDKDFQQLAIFDDVRKLYENIDDYKSVYKDGFDEYESQAMEVDCRENGESKAAFYFEAVDKYLAGSQRD